MNSCEVDTDGTTFSISSKGTTLDSSQISVGSSGLVIERTVNPISVSSFRNDEGAVATDPINLDRRWIYKIIHSMRVPTGASVLNIVSPTLSFVDMIGATSTRGYRDSICGSS